MRLARPLESDAARFVIVAALVACVAMTAWNWQLPGLYMDSVNPEYIIASMLHPQAPGSQFWVLPGNAIAGRFPVFTGTLYHGSTQLYFALPFMLALGTSVFAMRLIQAVVGCLIILGCMRFARGESHRHRVLVLSLIGLLVLDPAFVLSLRTQAYSCLFPLMFMLPSVGMLRGRPGRALQGWFVCASGVLFGLAVFSYFIFVFFLPVMVLLAWRRPTVPGVRARVRTGLIWSVGALIGFAPFLFGIALIHDALGGVHPLLAWLHHHGEQMQIVDANTGIASRIAAVPSDYRDVLDGDWPRLAMLNDRGEGNLGAAKAVLMLAVPLVALAVVRRIPERRSDLALPLLLTVSFLSFASFFGKRLDGHHYTVLLPLLYIAFAHACATLIELAARQTRAQVRYAATALVFACMFFVPLANVLALWSAQARLEATGGVALYSDSLNRFALETAEQSPDATVYFVNWGFEMPFVYLTGAALEHRDTIDPQRIAEQTCAGKSQVVVFAGDANDAKNVFVARLAGRATPPLLDWKQRDGTTVFQTARFPGDVACDDHAGQEVAPMPIPPFVSTSVKTASACTFMTPLAVSVMWDAGPAGSDRTSVWVQGAADEPKLWTGGKARGEETTGHWVTPGMTFLLEDDSGDVIATATVAAEPCPFH